MRIVKLEPEIDLFQGDCIMGLFELGHTIQVYCFGCTAAGRGVLEQIFQNINSRIQAVCIKSDLCLSQLEKRYKLIRR